MRNHRIKEEYESDQAFSANFQYLSGAIQKISDNITMNRHQRLRQHKSETRTPEQHFNLHMPD